jgi:hypothetical protein
MQSREQENSVDPRMDSSHSRNRLLRPVKGHDLRPGLPNPYRSESALVTLRAVWVVRATTSSSE